MLYINLELILVLVYFFQIKITIQCLTDAETTTDRYTYIQIYKRDFSTVSSPRRYCNPNPLAAIVTLILTRVNIYHMFLSPRKIVSKQSQEHCIRSTSGLPDAQTK